MSTINSETFVRDLIFEIKSGLETNIVDPLSGNRPTNSKFIMTSYPQREAVYPLITIKNPNFSAQRAGMQVNNMDMQVDVELRSWGRNQKEKEVLFTSGLNILRTMQFTSGGTIEAGLHDFNLDSAVEIDEDGENAIKSRVATFTYQFYNI